MPSSNSSPCAADTPRRGTAEHTAIGGGGSVSLLRLCEACELHKSTYHSSDNNNKFNNTEDIQNLVNDTNKETSHENEEGDGGDETVLQEECKIDLKQILCVLPQMEYDMIPSNITSRTISTIMRRLHKSQQQHSPHSYSSPSSSSSLSMSLEESNNIEIAEEVITNGRYLCNFYHSILIKGFCKHSRLLLDDGRGGVEGK